MSPASIAMVLASVGFQVFGLAMLPLTKGLTSLVPTLAFAASFMVGLDLMARLSHNGVDLSLLVPLTSTLIPLCVLGIGVLYYGVAASLAKIGLLVMACALIGLASVIG